MSPWNVRVNNYPNRYEDVTCDIEPDELENFVNECSDDFVLILEDISIFYLFPHRYIGEVVFSFF